MSWRRGVAVLWILFILIALGEVFELLVYLAAAGSQWLGLIAVFWVSDVLRLVAVCGGFVALWLGWGRTRWGLAVVAFLVGARTVLGSFLVDYHRLNPDAAAAPEAFGTLFYFGATLALGVLYLILAAYLLFSADLLAFVQHRREAGRGWVVVPVGLLVGVYCAAMLSARFVLRHELEGMRPEMLRLARHDAEAMASHWDPASIVSFLDPKSLEYWPEAGRQNLMNILQPLGSFLGPGEEQSTVRINPGEFGTSFFIRGTCQEVVRCTEGRATFSFTLVRPFSGPWRVVDLSMGDLQLYNPLKPAAIPAATPVPPPGG